MSAGHRPGLGGAELAAYQRRQNKNPFSGKWMLAKTWLEYKHSSAMYYETGKQGGVNVKCYMEMEDVAFITNA